MARNYDNPRQVLSEWNSLVNAADNEGVLALYSKEAVLLPTFSRRIRASNSCIEDYFEGLTGFESIDVAIKEDTLATQLLAGSVYCLSGRYTWEWTKDGVDEQREARFSYVIDIAAEAPILHHHSSLLPHAP